MQGSISIREFHQRFQKRLKLSYASGQVGQDREIRLSTGTLDSYEAVDYLNVIRPSSVVVIGRKESVYLETLSQHEQQLLFENLFKGPVTTIVITSRGRLVEPMLRLIGSADRPVFRSEMDDADLLSNLRFYLGQALAETTTEHGVFLEIHSIGTFLTGASGVGKSELALSLISRGHRLIADDITAFSRVSPSAVDGMHPGLSNDFMEVRGLGILNIRAMFGSNALRRNKTLRMIVNMVEFTPENQHVFDRLGTTQKTRTMLGLEVPEFTLPVAPGRNLAVLVEAAARNHLLRMGGYNSAEDFIERQRRAIKANAKG
jgi:HPr kinase/phosphorylase